eukprot:TRINITY_DN9572_c0_g1_i6.p1 TRINITY_DN9572_c0_g1~~TRINITY_DN9572_c0_g1_i6.p1  ORF type:complete len:671 (+),score=169.50 TRINITY_DN9572_c0_g1_i6:118-2130(+)
MKLAAPVLLVFCATASASLRQSTYRALDGNSGLNTCTRLLNETHEIGCTSPEGGAIGILFQIAEQAHLDAFEAASEDAYIALIDARMLTPANYKRMLALSHYKGALVYTDTVPAGFSPDNRVPNQDNGLPFGDNPTDWNANGGGFGPGSNLNDDGGIGMHFLNHGDRPLYRLTEQDKAQVFALYSQYNSDLLQGKTDYPLYSAQLFNFMYGVRDAKLCLRREHCDPVSGQNVFGTVRLMQKNEEVVMAAAQMDSLALFHDASYGANADASGLVTLITAARILSRADNKAVVDALQRNIMFMLFNGEALGYIGSSRLGVDLFAGNRWPSADLAVDFDHVKGYLELSQLVNDGSLHAYAKNSNPDVAATVAALQAAAGDEVNITSVTDQTASELPPVSLRGLIHEQRDVTKQDAMNAVVLTGYPTTGFANEYYHSRFDTGDSIGASSDETMGQLCAAARMTARVLVAMANDTDVSGVTLNSDQADCDQLKAMLVCITSNQTCELASRATGLTGAQPNTPLSRYIGVTRAATTLQRGAFFMFQMLSEALSVGNITVDDDTCAPNNNVSQYQTVQWVNGDCYNTTTYVSRAISPAFAAYYSLSDVGTAEANYTDGRDPRWSTWTESVWGSVSGRTFIQEDPRQELATLLGGLFYGAAVTGIVFAFTRYTTHGAV